MNTDSTQLPSYPMRRSGNPLDPPPEYARLRENSPITKVRIWNGQEVWMITRWEDVREVLSSPFVSVDSTKPGFPFFSEARKVQLSTRRTFINMDPPDHALFRRMLTREFTVKRINNLKPYIREIVERLFDAMEMAGGPINFNEAVALPLPSIVISTMLGIPYEHHKDLQRWAETRNDLSAKPEDIIRAADSANGLISAILKEKEKNPGEGNDLLSRLIINHVQPGDISHEEAVQMAALLFTAGHETTANQIALTTLSFLEQPGERAKLSTDPEILGRAIEEMLRFHTIVHYNSARVAAADFVLAGQKIRKGDGIYAMIFAANRDPSVFTDPDTIDLTRKENAHLAFSFGLHQCLGQPLARAELEVLFSELFRRFPGLRLADSSQALEFGESGTVYGVKNLMVDW